MGVKLPCIIVQLSTILLYKLREENCVYVAKFLALRVSTN